MSDERGYWVWVFGVIDGLRWVLSQRRMAFSEAAATRARRIRPGDRAVLYTTRGAFNNPTRDEARLQGLVTVTSAPEQGEPIEIAGRSFPWTCDIHLEMVLPERTGPLVRDLAPQLALVARPEAWGGYFRSPPVQVTKDDFDILARAIRGHAASPAPDAE